MYDKITFTLKGRTGPVFYTTGAPMKGAAVVSVHGFTRDGKLQVLARYADVDFTDHYITEPEWSGATGENEHD